MIKSSKGDGSFGSAIDTPAAPQQHFGGVPQSWAYWVGVVLHCAITYFRAMPMTLVFLINGPG